MSIQLVSANQLNQAVFDAVVIVSSGINALAKLKCPEILGAVENYAKINHSLDKGIASLIPADQLHAKRIIYSSTGSVHGDFDDARRFTDAGIAAGKMVLSACARSPLLVALPSERFPNAQLLAAVGMLHAFYTLLNVREEADSAPMPKADLLGIYEQPQDGPQSMLKLLQTVQHSFNVCRDIGDGDPQRMCPSKVVDYVLGAFNSRESAVSVRIIDDVDEIRRQYPLLAAVSRCANVVEEHKARVIWLEYDGSGGADVAETLFLVGKGVTIDTGGCDLKVGGAMEGMSRDKYGSAVVAGFFRALDELRPQGIKVVGCMCMCRNSIGANAYTCDEIITSRSGKRVHVCNTDAEGRMAMADPLAECREKALAAKNPLLMTIATLTGHAYITYGHCAAAMENGPSREVHYAQQLQQTGDAYGQPVEVSRLFNEDFDFHSPEFDGADLRQSNNKPSAQTVRGHMCPAAFLMRVSRLDECGMDSGRPIKYTHLDIHGCMGPYPQTSMPTPLLALIAHHILPKTKL